MEPRQDVEPATLDPDRAAVAAAQRDPARFETLYRRHVAAIYSYTLYEMRDPHVAEDCTEQVFLQALAGIARFRPGGADGHGTFRTWLFRIARNVVANERRRVRRHPAAPLDPDLPLAAPDDPAEAVVRGDEAARAWAAVARLPDDRRRALILRVVEEMSPREIAVVLGRSEGAVRVLVHRALRAVADDLAPEAPAPRVRWWRR